MALKITPYQGKLAGFPQFEQMLEQARREGKAAELPRQEVVLVVHGTFANPTRDSTTYDRPRAWWETFGSFTKALDEALERRGSKARCHTPVERTLFRRGGAGASWFGWSGDNSEVGRRRGAYELSQHIRFLHRDPGVSRIHIVAHSHGGNVVRRALRYLNDPQAKLGAVVFLGTPFLHFADTAVWRRWLAAVHWPMLVAFVALATVSVYVTSRPGASNVYFGYSLAAIAAAAGYSLWRYFRTSEGNSFETPALALRFANDEAIQLLRSCALLTSEPHLYLRDLLGGPTAKRALRKLENRPRPFDGWFERVGRPFSFVWRLSANGFAMLSNIWNGPVCRAVEKLTTLAYRIPLAGNVCALLLIGTMRPYRPPLRPFLSSRIPRLGTLFFYSIEEEGARVLDASDSTDLVRSLVDHGEGDDALRRIPVEKPWWGDALKGTPFDPETARSAAAFAAASLYVVFYPIDKLLGLPSWFGAVMTRFAILMGVRAAASGAPGVDVLGGAFKPVLTGTVPPRITEMHVPEAIERDIEHRLASTSRIDFATLRSSIDPAKRASLFAMVKLTFTDVGLLHAQYYQDARIVDYIAQRIADSTTPEWIVDSTSLEVATRASPAASPTEPGETAVS
jgi:hypothetical protein